LLQENRRGRVPLVGPTAGRLRPSENELPAAGGFRYKQRSRTLDNLDNREKL